MGFPFLIFIKENYTLMTCKKCGKPIEDGEEYCLTCKSEEKDIRFIEEETGATYGLSKALLSLIFSVVAGFILIFVTVFVGFMFAGQPKGWALVVCAVLCGLVAIFAMALSCLGHGFSIRNFILCVNRLRYTEKPVGPFVLSCAGSFLSFIVLCWSIVSIILVFVSALVGNI